MPRTGVVQGDVPFVNGRTEVSHIGSVCNAFVHSKAAASACWPRPVFTVLV